MESIIAKHLGVSRLVVGLRVTYIVIHTFLPVVVGLGMTVADTLPLGFFGYAVFAFAVIGVIFFLSLQFTELPKSTAGMLRIIFIPMLFVVLYQLLFDAPWLVSLTYLTFQEMLSVTFLGMTLWWYEYQQPKNRDNTLQGFVGVLVVVLMVALVLLGLWLHPNTLVNAGVFLYMFVSAAFEARLAFRPILKPHTSLQ